MPAEFDAYHAWLGIPPEEQPPTHYRLLGLAETERDPKVIENAAERQMTYLRNLQTGKHGKLSQRLLNEVAQACNVLLSPVERAAYDARLAEKRDAARPLSALDLNSGTPLLRPMPARGRRANPAPTNLVKLISGGLVGVTLILALLLYGLGFAPFGTASPKSQTATSGGAQLPPTPAASSPSPRSATPPAPAGLQPPPPPPIPTAKAANAQPAEIPQPKAAPTPAVVAEGTAAKSDRPASAGDIRVETPGKLLRLAPGSVVFGDRPYFWTAFPEELQDAQFWQTAGVHQGTMEFEVLNGRTIYLAVTTRWAVADAKRTAQDEYDSKAELLEAGWQEVGRMQNDERGKPFDWLVFRRECKAGERFKLRTEKYCAPVPILAKPG